MDVVGRALQGRWNFNSVFFFSFQDKESYTSWMKKSAGQIEEKTNGYNIMKQRLGHYSQESGLTVQLRGCVYGGNGRKTFWGTTQTRRVYCHRIYGKISNSGTNRRHFFALAASIVFGVGNKGKMYSLKFLYVHWSVELLTATDMAMVSSINSTYRHYQI